jgi:hypothetical protein
VEKLKKINILFSSILACSLVGCANTAKNNSQVIIDPAYTFLSPNSGDRMILGTIIDFHITSLSSNKMTGYLTNNVFNIDDNIVLFKIGDVITADYNVGSGVCGLTNVKIKNINGGLAPITDYYLMLNGHTYNCGTTKQQIINGNDYSINLTSTANIPKISGGVGVPDIYSSFINNQLDTEKQYKIIANRQLSWVPIAVADNGIQTIIKSKETSNEHLPVMLFNKVTKPINVSVRHDGGFNYMIVDGVYSHYVISSASGESFGEVHILRTNPPDSQNTIVSNLFIDKGKFYQSINNIPYKPDSNVGIMANSDLNQVKSNSSQPSGDVKLYKQSNDPAPNITNSNGTPTITVRQANTDNNVPDITDNSGGNPMSVSIMGNLNFNSK